MVILNIFTFAINLHSTDNNNNWEESVDTLLNKDESLEEQEKLSYLCYCAIDSLKVGGSVLIPINRLGTLLQLLEQISASLESSTLKVALTFFSFLFLEKGRGGVECRLVYSCCKLGYKIKLLFMMALDF